MTGKPACKPDGPPQHDRGNQRHHEQGEVTKQAQVRSCPDPLEAMCQACPSHDRSTPDESGYHPAGARTRSEPPPASTLVRGSLPEARGHALHATNPNADDPSRTGTVDPVIESTPRPSPTRTCGHRSWCSLWRQWWGPASSPWWSYYVVGVVEAGSAAPWPPCAATDSGCHWFQVASRDS